MTPKEQLIREIEQAPEALVEEVLSFLVAARNRHAHDAEAQTSDRSKQPIWELFEEAAENLPDEVVAQLPTDGSEQIDHYLYGSPKR